MTKEFEGSGRGKKRNQKMKPFLVYQYLMRHTDENHVITGEDICSAMADIYGIEAERRGIYRDIDEINKPCCHLRHAFLLLKVRFSYRITPQSVFDYRGFNDCFIYYE